MRLIHWSHPQLVPWLSSIQQSPPFIWNQHQLEHIVTTTTHKRRPEHPHAMIVFTMRTIPETFTFAEAVRVVRFFDFTFHLIFIPRSHKLVPLLVHALAAHGLSLPVAQALTHLRWCRVRLYVEGPSV